MASNRFKNTIVQDRIPFFFNSMCIYTTCAMILCEVYSILIWIFLCYCFQIFCFLILVCVTVPDVTSYLAICSYLALEVIVLLFHATSLEEVSNIGKYVQE